MGETRSADARKGITMRSALRTLSLGLLVVTAAACEDGINFCTNRDDAGQCPETPDFVFDGGLDATTPPSDASTDARTADASAVDANSGLDASADANVADSGLPASYDVEGYCAAQYAVAVAWRDKFEACCATATTAADERSLFLLQGLLYEDGSDKAESVGACVSNINAALGANLTFNGNAAVGCAARFAAQFTAPPAECPIAGFKIEELEASIGHRAQSTAQLSECRTAFAGKVALNGTCTNSFQCASGNRCRGSENSKTCLAPLSLGNPCTVTSECADGFVCQGATSAGRSCQPANAPVAPTGNCSLSTECDTGYLCDTTCVRPAPAVICAQASP